MPPRTRSNRAAKLAKDRLLASGVALNTRGFPNLPDELYLEILSHMPTLKLPHDSWIDAKPDPYRQLTLFSLSQTCQSLRRFFLKFAWERIEVFEGMWTPEGRLSTKAERLKRGGDMRNVGDKKLVQEILRQLETVTIRNPQLACHVNTVNLKILKYSHFTVLAEIAERMTHLPNLHTLQLIFFFWGILNTTYFSSYSYPQIHTLSLNNFSPHNDILAACPNVRRFVNYKDAGSTFALESILHADCAAHLEVLGMQQTPRLGLYLLEFAKFLPRLRDLALHPSNFRIAGEALNCLSSLPLHTLRLILADHHLPVYLRGNPPTPAECQSWISLAKRILENCPQLREQKKFVVVNYDKTVEIHLI